MVKKAKIRAIAKPPAIAKRAPMAEEPVRAAPRQPKRAPTSIIPSVPIFTIPARSLKTSPRAARRSGVAVLISAVRKLVIKSAMVFTSCYPVGFFFL